jgi:hypothetical protein
MSEVAREKAEAMHAAAGGRLFTDENSLLFVLH